MNRFLPALVVLMATGVSGCAYVGPSEDAVAKQRYETYGPKFTEEEKAQMSTEEKMAVYNKEVRQKDRVVCRRERSTGSHFQRTKCYTQEEIRQARNSARAALEENRRGPIPTE